MDILLLAARLGLAVIFAVAGIAKLIDLPGSRKAVLAFGLPEPIAGPIGIALPISELVLAIALVPRSTAWWAAIGAVLLLGAFLTAIAVNLARGRTPDCHCFGQLHSEPVGAETLVRNGAFITLALLIVGFGWSDPGLSAIAWIGEPSMSNQMILLIVVAQCVAIGFGWWLSLNLLGQNGRILQRLTALEEAPSNRQVQAPPTEVPPGLPVGTRAPAFTLNDHNGQSLSLDSLRATGKSVLALFMSPGCLPCASLLPDIARWQRDLAGTFTIAVVASGTLDANREKFAGRAIDQVLLDTDRTVASMYQSNRTPAAVIIRPDGTIATPLIGGATAIRRLMQPAAVDVLPTIGALAPTFALPDTRGNTITSANFAGRDLVLLFWSPTCGFCHRMTADLKRWLAQASDTAPRVVLISSGTADDPALAGFDAPVLLDDGFYFRRSLGVRGTPSAILIDSQGHIASRIMTGAPGVFDLLGGVGNEDQDQLTG